MQHTLQTEKSQPVDIIARPRAGFLSGPPEVAGSAPELMRPAAESGLLGHPTPAAARLFGRDANATSGPAENHPRERNAEALRCIFGPGESTQGRAGDEDEEDEEDVFAGVDPGNVWMMDGRVSRAERALRMIRVASGAFIADGSDDNGNGNRNKNSDLRAKAHSVRFAEGEEDLSDEDDMDGLEEDEDDLPFVPPHLLHQQGTGESDWCKRPASMVERRPRHAGTGGWLC